MEKHNMRNVSDFFPSCYVIVILRLQPFRVLTWLSWVLIAVTPALANTDYCSHNHKLTSINFLLLSSKHRLKSASRQTLNISIQSIHSALRIYRKAFILLAQNHFWVPRLLLWLKSMHPLLFLQCRFQYRLRTVVMLIHLKCLYFYKLKKIHVSFRESWDLDPPVTCQIYSR